MTKPSSSVSKSRAPNRPGCVVVTDYDYPSLEVEREVIEGAGFILLPYQLNSEEEIIDAGQEADVLLNQYAPLTG